MSILILWTVRTYSLITVAENFHAYTLMFTSTANVRTLNSEDRPWSQQNGSYGALNLYYVEDQDITQGIIAFANLGVVSSLLHPF